MDDIDPRLYRAMAEGTASMLLTVQQECSAQRKRADAAEQQLAEILKQQQPAQQTPLTLAGLARQDTTYWHYLVAVLRKMGPITIARRDLFDIDEKGLELQITTPDDEFLVDNLVLSVKPKDKE